MWLYTQLIRRLPRPLAITLTACWFALLILAIAFGAFEPRANFIYGNL
ncbi:hypothetical protein [Pelagibius sp.]|nr:hypothetical protein [Pelagibius sp.]